MGHTSNFELRNATLEDQAFLEHLFLESHRNEFAILGMDEAQLDGLLRMQARGQRMSYGKVFANATDKIILDEEGVSIGRFLVDFTGDALHLIDIALLPSARGRCIGSTLLGGLIEESNRSGIPVKLSVQAGNRAFHLYKRLGFEVLSNGVSVQMEYRPGASAGVADTPIAARKQEALPGDEWKPLVGREFDLNLHAVDGLPTLRLDRFQQSAIYDRSFTLYFHGPSDPFLQQGIYPLRLKDVADEQEWLIFLVPIGPEAGCMCYEAVFNC
jgi:ribosomal protein S18 acetylase RimI-like enzyme